MIMPPMRAGPLTVRPADPMDAIDLAPRLRPWDLVECLANGCDPIRALKYPFEEGHGPLTWALEKDGELIAMGGLYPIPLQSGAAIWLLGTDDLDRAGMPFLSLSKPWVAHALKMYSPLLNVVPARCHGTIRWLRWLGFDIDHASVHFHGVQFRHFRLSRAERPE